MAARLRCVNSVQKLTQRLAAADLRVQAAILDARTFDHFGNRGGSFESDVREHLRAIVPAGLAVSSAEPMVSLGAAGKQLDFVVHLPVTGLWGRGEVTLLHPGQCLVTGEVKLRLDDSADITTTARKISTFGPKEGTVPFVVIAGESRLGDRALLSMVTEMVETSPNVEPAVFTFGADGSAVFAVNSDSSPIVAWDAATGKKVTGAVAIAAQRSTTALLYVWLWAALADRTAVPSLDLAYMSEVITEITSGKPIEARLMRKRTVTSLSVVLGVRSSVAKAPIAGSVVTSRDMGDRQLPRSRSGGVLGQRKVMLINLGDWIDRSDSWDESHWGGTAYATRTGHGFYEGMTESELLGAARLFWRFQPRSATWEGIEYAVVVHRQITRAVIKIDKFIGPFWGRHGFQGSVVRSKALVDELVGRNVAPPRNPVTSWPSTQPLLSAAVTGCPS